MPLHTENLIYSLLVIARYFFSLVMIKKSQEELPITIFNKVSLTFYRVYAL
jgi:hypothetical protein